MKNIKFYLGLIITIIVSYVLIQFVDSYSYFWGIITKFLSLLTPFFIGMILAYILSPLVEFMEKKLKLKRWLTILIIYGVTLTITVVFLIMVVPSITNSIIEIINQIPQYSSEVESWIVDIVGKVDRASMAKVEESLLLIVPKFGELINVLLSYILNGMVTMTTLVVNLILGLIISVYIIIDKENILYYIKKVTYILLKKEKARLVVEVIKTFNSNIGTYIVAKSIDSFFVGLVSFIGLSLIGSKYALLLGILCGITNMIPYFGPIIGMVPTVIINMFYSPSVAIGCLVFLVILQQIEGNIIEPKFVGGKLGLSPILTLLAVTIGGGFFGIIGMVLSVPVMGVIKIYLDKIIEKYKYREKED
ncbi:MAG: AI-2E family transporter [Clostridium sp.]|uniref:AI-2E family transporter n=1 Tax=Clostridium sp. TaxID=1506 RepID=UPI0030617A78